MTFRTNRRSALKALAAGTSLAAMGYAGRLAAQQNTIKFGAIYALSGAGAVTGNAMLAGARIAAAEANASGGINGRQIEIVARDDKSSPAEAALAGRDLMGSGVKFLLGGIQAPIVRALIPLLGENDGLMMMASTQMPLAHEEYNPRTFRCQLNARMSQFAMARAVAAKYPTLTKWGTVTPDLEFGHANWAMFSGALKKFYGANASKLEFAPPALHKFGATDYKVQAAAMMSAGVQAVQAGMFGGDTITFMTQAQQLGLFERAKVVVDSGQGIFGPKAMGPNMPGIDWWSSTQWYSDAKDANATSKALAKAYLELTKDTTPDPMAVLGHSAIKGYVTAMRKAGSLESAKVQAALEEIEFEAANGPMRFRKEDHQAMWDVPVIKVVKKAGEPGWEVTESVTVKAADVMEPPTPGKKFEEA